MAFVKLEWECGVEQFPNYCHLKTTNSYLVKKKNEK